MIIYKFSVYVHNPFPIQVRLIMNSQPIDTCSILQLMKRFKINESQNLSLDSQNRKYNTLEVLDHDNPLVKLNIPVNGNTGLCDKRFWWTRVLQALFNVFAILHGIIVFFSVYNVYRSDLNRLMCLIKFFFLLNWFRSSLQLLKALKLLKKTRQVTFLP